MYHKKKLPPSDLVPCDICGGAGCAKCGDSGYIFINLNVTSSHVQCINVRSFVMLAILALFVYLLFPK